ncbi:MAG: TIR domain-containing protein [Pseudomonadota bacterium]
MTAMERESDAGRPVPARSKAMVILCEHDDDFKRDAMSLIRAVGLQPLDIKTDANPSSPNRLDTIPARIERLFEQAEVFVVVFSGDDVARNADIPLASCFLQPRQNVVYEAGRAYQTGKPAIAIQVGGPAIPTDLGGLKTYRYRPDAAFLSELKRAFESLGVKVDDDSFDPGWKSTGALERWRLRRERALALARLAPPGACLVAFLCGAVWAPWQRGTSALDQTPGQYIEVPPTPAALQSAEGTEARCTTVVSVPDDSSDHRRTPFCVDTPQIAICVRAQPYTPDSTPTFPVTPLTRPTKGGNP